MGPRVDVELDEASLKAVEAEVLTGILTSASRAVGKATRALEQDLEAQTRAATQGNAWRAWKSAVYPRGGRPAYEPVGEVFANGGKRSKGMLSYWSLPGTNRALSGRYLAVPLRAALGTPLGNDISPQQWQARFRTKLRPLFRPGKTPLLVADGALGAGGFTAPRMAGAMRRGGQKLTKTMTIAVFALIEEQPHANRVSLGVAQTRARDLMISELGKGIARL